MELKKVKDLHKYPNNPRTYKEKDLQNLMDSITKYPDYFEKRSILLSDRTGELIIICGNMKYDAAVKLGLKEVPTETMHDLTEKREKEILLLDNLHQGSWDDILLKDFEFTNIGFEPPIGIEQIEKFEGSDKEFVQEFNKITDSDAKMPIVPDFMESYSCFIIITKNDIDELYVRNVLKLTQVMGNTCKLSNRLSNVITVEQLKEALK